MKNNELNKKTNECKEEMPNGPRSDEKNTQILNDLRTPESE